MANYVNINGEISLYEEAGIPVNNRGFRYGDGIFETMKMISGEIPLLGYHFERLFASLDIMHFVRPGSLTTDNLTRQIQELAKKNGHSSMSKIRLTIYRGNGGLFDEGTSSTNFLIESYALQDAYVQFNHEGIFADIYPDAFKSCDKFSNIKSNNFLPYVMGAIWAKNNLLDEACILNAYGRIADATISNIFIVSSGIIKTPSLEEGCISGVMRKFLLNAFMKNSIAFEETKITITDLLEADEVFLTNSTYGIRHIKKMKESIYSSDTALHFHNKFILPLYHNQ